MISVTTGLEHVREVAPTALTGKRPGLLMNPSGIDRRFQSTIDLIMSHPDLDPGALFGREHEVRREAQAGDHVASGMDPRTGQPVHSLYGATRVPTTEMLDGIDTIVIEHPNPLGGAYVAGNVLEPTYASWKLIPSRRVTESRSGSLAGSGAGTKTSPPSSLSRWWAGSAP